MGYSPLQTSLEQFYALTVATLGNKTAPPLEELTVSLLVAGDVLDVPLPTAPGG